MEHKFHPVADLFPLLSGTAFEELVADIRQNGLREPILVDAEGRIVDGRNRYRACLAAGVEPRFIEWEGEGSLAELSLSLNLKRRHLDESQRAMVAAKLAKLLEKPVGRPRKNQANLPDFLGGEYRSTAAATVNISPRLVTTAIKVLRDGCEELVAAVESGAVAVSPAGVLAALPVEEQKTLLAAGPTEVARKVRELRAGKSNSSRPGASPGSFGVARDLEKPGTNGVTMLWVATGGLDEAIDALKARGFVYTA